MSHERGSAAACVNEEASLWQRVARDVTRLPRAAVALEEMRQRRRRRPPPPPPKKTKKPRRGEGARVSARRHPAPPTLPDLDPVTPAGPRPAHGAAAEAGAAPRRGAARPPRQNAGPGARRAPGASSKRVPHGAPPLRARYHRQGLGGERQGRRSAPDGAALAQRARRCAATSSPSPTRPRAAAAPARSTCCSRAGSRIHPDRGA